MRLAVFTNQFPSRVSTFFARDMRALLKAGVELDIFPIYPLDPSLWRYVPDILSEDVLPRNKVHHSSFAQSFRIARPWPLGKLYTFLRDIAAVSASAAGFGVAPLAKSAYVFLKAWAWAQQYPDDYDHVLAYWGNYTATCAYISHRLIDRQIPFSIFVHAGIDLYQDQLYMRQKLLYAENIITCSEFNRQFIHHQFFDIVHLISKKIYVHYHGLDLNEFSYGMNSRRAKKVIAVGMIERQKGFDYLLRAISQLRYRGLDVEVELVGDGKQADKLRELAKELRIEEGVRFRGWLNPNEVRNAMREATILAHPSPDLGDGVPNVIKECMALGIPVVASNVAGIPELLDNGKNGILVPPKDVNALANAIESLLASDTLQERYVETARKYAEKQFDLWRNGQCLADLLCTTRRPMPNTQMR